MSWTSERKVETYSIELTCSNCQEVLECDIPKGTRVEEYAKNEVCSECGCKGTLMQEDD